MDSLSFDTSNLLEPPRTDKIATGRVPGDRVGGPALRSVADLQKSGLSHVASAAANASQNAEHLPAWSPRPAQSSRASRGPTYKRLMDIIISSTALVLLAPLFAMVAVLVRMRMGEGVFFAHERVGLNGAHFACFKFRTMVSGADTALAEHLRACPAAQQEWNETRKLRDDPRVTSLGRILRKSSLDELPQFFNVLRGDMSCVGPRPVIPAELARYGAHATDYKSVRPGLTGIWQVSGRSHLSYEERVALDVDYVRHQSLGRDIVILLKTIPAVAKFEDAA